MGRVGIDDIEDLRSLRVGLADRDALLDDVTECTFVVGGHDGWPCGVIMSFVRDGDVFWLTAVSDRAHARAAAADPRVTLVFSNAGASGRQSLSVRGLATVHTDAATKARFFDIFAARHAPGDTEEFIRLLDSAKRVVIEVRPVAISASHDSRKLPGDGRGGGRRADGT